MHRDIVVIGTSAGGLEALQSLFSALPEHLNAAILVVIHRAGNAGSLISELLGRKTSVPVVEPEDGESIRKGRIYVAPAGVHMLVQGERIRLVRGPLENRHRPAIDPLFRSAAANYGPRVIGVILTGMLDDGTSGTMVVSAHGGTAIVQNPLTAMFPAMPQNALNGVPGALVLDLQQIPNALRTLLEEELLLTGRELPGNDGAIKESRIAEMDMRELENERRMGKSSEFGCPGCGGVLWEIQQGELLRFRCRVGHAYTAEHLEAAQRHAVETALWAALRALEESLSMYKRLSSNAKAREQLLVAKIYQERIATTEANARTLKDFLLEVNARGEEEDVGAEESA